MPEIERRGGRVVYENPWLRVLEDDVVFPDGTEGRYSVIDKRDFVLVLPYENEGFWLVEQFRYPVGRRVWEFPQGGWPAGRSGTQLELARAELREETGLTAASYRHLGRLFASYGYSNQAYDVFLAAGLTAGAPDRESSEQDMVHRWFPETEVRAMVADGRFADAHSVAALTLLDQLRSGGVPLEVAVSEVEVVDNPAERRYEIRVDGARAGIAAYGLRDGAVVFTHTEVDPEHEGEGLAGRLARGALDDVIRQGKLIVPLCPFIAAWIARHPEYAEHVDPEHRARFTS